jgi:2-acylglycerol O-acyltransferase 2
MEGPPRFEPLTEVDPRTRPGECVLVDLSLLCKAELENPLDTIPGYQGPSAARDARFARIGERSLDLRLGADKVQELQTMTYAEELQTLVMLFVFFFSFFFWPILLGVLVTFWSVTHAAVAVLIGFIVGRALPIRRWPPFLLTRNMRYLLCKYFSLKIVTHEVLDAHTPWMFCSFPHGVFPVSNVLALVLVPVLRGFYFNGLAATALLKLPLAGNLLGMLGAEDCSKDNVRRLMMEERRSVALLPGGITEIFYNSQGVECIYIKKRKGFVKLALQAGHPIVPIYTFGNTDLLHCLNWSILKWISAKLRVSITFFWGRWGSPIPYRKPLLLAVGRPIDVPTVANPSDAQINEYHQKVIDATIALFDAHKADFGWGHKTLHIC